MASPFEIRGSNVRIEIESVTPDAVTGQVDIKFKVTDPRIANFQLNQAKYDIGAGYLDMTILPNETRDNITVIDLDEDIPAKATPKSYVIVWDSGADITLIDHASVNIRVRGEDSDGTDDIINTFGSAVAVNLLPVISRHPLPLEFLKDTTPELVFQVPSSVKACNMHFTLTIADNAELNTPTIEVDSSSDQTGWEFQNSVGDYKVFGVPGCPDISALISKARAKYTVQVADALALDVYYYQFVVKTAIKKVPIDQLDINPEDLGYPENY